MGRLWPLRFSWALSSHPASRATLTDSISNSNNRTNLSSNNPFFSLNTSYFHPPLPPLTCPLMPSVSNEVLSCLEPGTDMMGGARLLSQETHFPPLLPCLRCGRALPGTSLLKPESSLQLQSSLAAITIVQTSGTNTTRSRLSCTALEIFLHFLLFVTFLRGQNRLSLCLRKGWLKGGFRKAPFLLSNPFCVLMFNKNNNNNAGFLLIDCRLSS